MISDVAGRLKSGLKQGVGRIATDQGGNVLLLTAAALLPLIGIIGSGVDIGRSYMTQLRLQQACDAGALAGRRAMAGGSYGNDQKDAAEDMFRFNFPTGMYGTVGTPSFTSNAPTRADVVGQAAVVLPTSLMHIFGFDQFSLSVNCGAKMEIANTDVMLVLDTTGSMAAKASTRDTKTKIEGLKDAVDLFLTTLLTAEKGDGRIRIGMVPYAATVNVGALLKPEWIVDEVTLPTREAEKFSHTVKECTGSGRNQTCKNVTKEYRYIYKDRKFNVASLGAEQEFTANTGTNGANYSHVWSGCIVERGPTKPFAVGAEIPSDAWDMDIDKVPDSDLTRWAPFLPHHSYARTKDSGSETLSTDNKSFAADAESRSGSPSSNYEINYGRCPNPAMKLIVMDDAEVGKKALLEQVKLLEPFGLTYHDSGMAWGARLISPDGLFASENRVAPNRRTIGRHIIFMTDGDTQVRDANYSHQGYEATMRRVAPKDKTDLEERHNYRFEQLCQRAKQKGVTIWVVGFGSGVGNVEPLRKCSSSGAALIATDNAQLIAAFETIAGQISRLRVSQ